MKNSETEISRWRLAIDWASAREAAPARLDFVVRLARGAARTVVVARGAGSSNSVAWRLFARTVRALVAIGRHSTSSTCLGFE